MDLIIDFGASNLKYALLSQQEVVESDSVDIGSSKFLVTEGDIKRINCKIIKGSLDIVLERLNHNNISRIFICSEMHGVSISYEYYSWMSLTNPESVDVNDFFSKTGIRPWAGLPAFTVESLIKKGLFRRGTYVGDFKDCFLDVHNNISNITTFSSTGLIDLEFNELLREFRDKLKIPKIIYNLEEILGYVKIANNSVPVYFGIGDLQASLYGVGYLTIFPIVINLGTGSQIALPHSFLSNKEVEKRIYIDGSMFPVLTHIPSGRILNIIANVMGKEEFWNIWSTLSPEEVLNANKSTYNIYGLSNIQSNDYGTMLIKDNYFHRDYIADLAHWYCYQYVEILEKFRFTQNQKKIALSGGISIRSGFICEVLKFYLTDFQIKVIRPKYQDFTLDGMIKLVNEVMN